MRRAVLLVLGAALIVLVGIVGSIVWVVGRVPTTPMLLIQHADGNLALVDEKGAQRALTDDANGETRTYDFPVPSPDGRSVAYVQAEREDEGVRSSLIMHDLRGKPSTLFSSTTVAPFYLYWSPDSSQLAFLGGSTDGMLLQNVNTRGKPTVKEVTPGEPSYFSWSPDSKQLLLHTRGSAPRGSIARWSIDGSEPQPLAAAPALFNAPAWLSDGKASVVVLQDEDGATLARLDDTGNIEQRLASSRDGMFFSVSPSGTSVAYAPLQGANIGPLHVVGMDGTEDRALSSVPAYAFVWSPDGTKIAYISVPSEAETSPAAFNMQQDLKLTWNVVDMATGQSRSLHTFEPTQAFTSLLPYFDQYAQSIRIWDQASERLVYADTAGVWTLDVASGETTKVDDGILGMWIER